MLNGSSIPYLGPFGEPDFPYSAVGFLFNFFLDHCSVTSFCVFCHLSALSYFEVVKRAAPFLPLSFLILLLILLPTSNIAAKGSFSSPNREFAPFLVEEEEEGSRLFVFVASQIPLELTRLALQRTHTLIRHGCYRHGKVSFKDITYHCLIVTYSALEGHDPNKPPPLAR